MNYALYEDSPEADDATRAADKIIEKFLQEMEQWSKKYSFLGSNDTASREAFAVNTAKKLRLKHYC